MDREIANNFLDYVEALFKLEFQPLYGASVYCDCGHFNKLSEWDYHLRCCICADIDGEWDEDKDWIIELNLDFDNAIRVNTKHPDYDEEMEEYLDDFIEEILKKTLLKIWNFSDLLYNINAIRNKNKQQIINNIKI